MKLYWKLMWGDPSEVRDPTLIPNERIEKIMTDAREKGRKDPQAQRDGVLHLGEAVRELIARYPQREGEHSSTPRIPTWELENLLEKWGVPDA